MEGGDVEYRRRIDEQCGLREDEDKSIVSKTRWVVKTGVRLGKKVVITGIVVSSAPLVLPPLITICVMGFMVLIPVGVVLASYACTEKLMSKLLPVEYQYSQVEEELYGRDYQGEFAIIQEEIMKMEGEERIESVRDNEEEEEGSQYVEKHDDDDDDKKGIGIDENLEDINIVDDDDGDLKEEGYEEEDMKDTNMDENLEKGYEEATGEYLEEEHEIEKDNIDEENLEKGYEEDVGEFLEGKEHQDNKEVKIDENLDEVYDQEAVIGKYLEGEHEDEKDTIDKNLNLEKGYEYLEAEHKDMEINIDGDLEEGYEEDIGEYLEEEEEHEEPMPDMNMETERGGGREELLHCEFGENVKRTDEAEENFEHNSVNLVGNIGSSMKENEEHLENLSGFEEEEDKKDSTRRSSKVDENPFIGTEAKVEITVAMVKETELAPETDEKQGYAAKQVSPGFPPPQHNQINEVMVSEEKIWEQISAIRGILGYTAVPQSSTVDELKALFILTGVEPPSPFEDPSDLADVDEKLRLLMSIVGAK